MLIKKNYSLSNISYIGIGGIVSEYILTKDIEEIKYIFNSRKNIIFIGETSNILFGFKFKDATIVKFISNNYYIGNDFFYFDSGIMLSKLINITTNNLIINFIGLSGIPGRLGGAVVNNSGCNGICISEYIEYMECIDENGKFRILKKDEILFSYHSSNIKNNKYFIYRIYFRKKTTYHDIKNIKAEYILSKIKKQDYEQKNLGSTFKNVNFDSIGKTLNLIKIYNKKADCCFSLRHGNFLCVNNEKSYENIMKLIESKSLLLYNKLGFNLDLEIEIIE